jgi:NADH-quinone oxidoreductase subunit F
MNLGISAGKSVFMHFSYDLKDYYNLLNKFSPDVEPAFREIEESGLRGRGGAGFPLYIKLRTSAGEYASRKYVVCNADEGDPGAFSDKWLLDNRPHAILFGMAVTGLLIGAETGILYIRGEYPESVRSVRRAIKEYERLGITMTGRNGENFKFEFIISVGQGAYICGEETALLNSLEGLRPEVRTRPPFPATYGLFGKPTIISNVETFANLWFILKEGGKVFSGLGTAKSKGTKLVSLDSGFIRPGVYEVEMGTALDKVLLELGGGTKYPVKAFQIGGPLGGIVPSFKTGDLTVDFESFSNAGFLLGHAGVVSIPSEFPMIRFLAHLLEFTSFESCGKCFPCRLGTKRACELLNAASENDRLIDRALFTDLLETLQLGSLCALGGGITLPVTNALTWFKEELSCFFTDNTQHP